MFSPSTQAAINDRAAGYRIVRPRPRRFLRQSEMSLLLDQVGTHDGLARVDKATGKEYFSQDNTGVSLPCCCQQNCCFCDITDPTKCLGPKVAVTISGVVIPTVCMYTAIAGQYASAVTMGSVPVNATWCLQQYGIYCFWWASVAATGTYSWWVADGGTATGFRDCAPGVPPANFNTAANCTTYGGAWPCTAPIKSLTITAFYYWDPLKGVSWNLQATVSTAPPGVNNIFGSGLPYADACNFGVVFGGGDYPTYVPSACTSAVTFPNDTAVGEVWFNSVICSVSSFGYLSCVTIPTPNGNPFGGSATLTPNATC
jgi:hypothetical protein